MEKMLCAKRCLKDKGGFYGEARSSKWGARQKTSVEKFDMSAALSMSRIVNTIIEHPLSIDNSLP